MLKSTNWKVKRINVPFLIISLVLFLRKKTQTHHWVWVIIKFRVKFNLVFFFPILSFKKFTAANELLHFQRPLCSRLSAGDSLVKQEMCSFLLLLLDVYTQLWVENTHFTAAHFQGCVQYPKCLDCLTVLYVKSLLRIVGLPCFAVADWTRRWRRSSTPISFCRCPPLCPPASSTAWQSTAPPSCRTSTGTHSACGPEMNLRL